MSENDEARQGLTGGPREELADGEAAAIVTQLRRRRHAAQRCAPLDCGHRDPLDCIPASCGVPPDDEPKPEPSTFGLTPEQLRAEANRLVTDEGWQLWEIATRLAIAPRRQHCECCGKARKADA
ncbi:hypothetical protein ACWGKK_12765 [Streptomyces chartreusis]